MLFVVSASTLPGFAGLGRGFESQDSGWARGEASSQREGLVGGEVGVRRRVGARGSRCSAALPGVEGQASLPPRPQLHPQRDRALRGHARAPPPQPMTAVTLTDAVEARTSPVVLREALAVHPLPALGLDWPELQTLPGDPGGDGYWHAHAAAWNPDVRVLVRQWRARGHQVDGAGWPDRIAVGYGIEDLAERIFERAGHEFNLASPQQLGVVTPLHPQP